MSHPTPSPLTLNAASTGLVVIDVQDRLLGAMPTEVVERHINHMANLLQTAQMLDLPVAATEQYPKGLGPTTSALLDWLPSPPLPKRAFSAMNDEGCAQAIEALDRRTLVVVGMETHICVYQTVRDLTAQGYTVHVPIDGVLSRYTHNYKSGLNLMEKAGATLTSTETVLFDWLKVAEGDTFKAVSKMIR